MVCGRSKVFVYLAPAEMDPNSQSGLMLRLIVPHTYQEGMRTFMSHIIRSFKNTGRGLSWGEDSLLS